ncbi:MAG: ATPase [Clostridiales bacterium]|nr:ATPase [Clostridiales bacterium]
MNVLALLDYLDEEISSASNVPLSNKCGVDREKCLDIINDIREGLPNEILEAEEINKEKNQILYDAEKESEQIVEDANDKVGLLVDQNKITQMAYEKAEEVIQNAETSAREIRLSANEYVEDILADLESYIQRNLDIVRQNRTQMRGH